MQRVGFVMVGTMGYGFVVVIALWMADTGYVSWGGTWAAIGGVLVLLGAGLIWDTVRAAARRGR